MDLVLHAERLAPPEAATFSTIPPGAIFAADDGVFLRTEQARRRWSFNGYGAESRGHEPDDILVPA